MENEKIIGAVENILFMAGEAIEIAELAQALGISKEELQQILQTEMKVREKGSGLLLKQFADRVHLCTRPEYAELIIGLLGEKNEEALSRAMLETLSIIAYRQPITKIEIEKIRGVKSDHAVNKLVEYNLVCEVGRLDAPGRPILFGTTEEFLRRFSVHSLDELPSLNAEQVENFKSEAEEEVQMKLNI